MDVPFIIGQFALFLSLSDLHKLTVRFVRCYSVACKKFIIMMIKNTSPSSSLLHLGNVELANTYISM